MKKNEEKDYEEIYVKYVLALRKLEAEIKNLIDAYNFNNNVEIVDHTKSRIKEYDSACSKLEKKGFDVTPENMEHFLNDMVGFRIVCPFTEDVYTIVNLLKNSHSFSIIKENDYIKNPKDSGYSSYHIDVSIPIKFNNEVVHVRGEVQVRTMAMDLWATLDHKLRYKLSDDIQNELSSEFLARARDMGRFDYRMQCLKDEVLELKSADSSEKGKTHVKKR